MDSFSTPLHLAQTGDKEAEVKLITRYLPVIIKFARRSGTTVDNCSYPDSSSF